MKVLLCEGMSGLNEYIKNLSEEYISRDIEVIYDVQNFLFSNVIVDFVHIQWPEAIFKWRYELEKNQKSLDLIENRLLWYKNQKIPIVYTIHNKLPHGSNSSFDYKVYEIITKYSDILVHHGKNSINIVSNTFPSLNLNLRHIIAPHGPYVKKKFNLQNSREYYNLPEDKYIFLNFGAQRMNKGAIFSRLVFTKWKKRNTILFTVGPYQVEHKKTIYSKMYSVIKRLLISFIYNKLYISLYNKISYKEIQNNEIANIIHSCDVFFLGHTEGLNSGIIALALSYGKPIIFPDIGNFKEQVEGWDWFECYSVNDPDSALDALERMLSKISDRRPMEVEFDNAKWLLKNSWKNHVDNILKAVNDFKKGSE